MKKYIAGRQIMSLDELMTKDFVIFHDKVYHKGWFQSWQLYFAISQIKMNMIFEAILNDLEGI